MPGVAAQLVLELLVDSAVDVHFLLLFVREDPLVKAEEVVEPTLRYHPIDPILAFLCHVPESQVVHLVWLVVVKVKVDVAALVYFEIVADFKFFAKLQLVEFYEIDFKLHLNPSFAYPAI